MKKTTNYPVKKAIIAEIRRMLIITMLAFFVTANLTAQKKKDEPKKDEKTEAKKEKATSLNSSTYSGLKFRGIGPAYTSGRISDFAINPKNTSEWYVAVSSGNIWKTTNNGHTFTAIFDNYGSYSIGCLAMDPVNPNVVWAGTGENNHQRALGYGDGVYKTTDGGKSWKNMGLKESRQIGMIAIDPRHTDIVFVAAEGSVWGPGGERGLYKTTDGGKTWKKVLDISENTGINNVIIDPSNPDIMFATSEQRRRHVHTKIGGGPESAVYKSVNGGETWNKLTSGLPSGHVGGMGIAISPANPDYVYIIVQADGESSGFYRSVNKGETWNKMSDHHESGQYYNEIYCDPINPDKVYSVETISHMTVDGGKTWKRIPNTERHVDDHALWINPANTENFIIGGDGGIYETFDGGENYRFISNLPVTQFYRVYLDNDYPFYNVYGGTQDNNSMGGPSSSTSAHGVPSGSWVTTLGGDGFWGAVDPEDPNIVYSEYQYGNIYRYDKKSGEALNIKPQPGKGELTYKWNWNTPFMISPHSKTRLYIAANKVFRSDDRGQSWKTISGDLTANIDRNTWPVMGKYWSSDAVAKDISTSLYGMAVSMSESPKKEGLLFIGTDDGLIQVTDNGGQSWQKYSVFPGVPANTYVSDIFPSNFDENIVFAAFDNILRDDFKPYLLRSDDKGKSWTSIAGDLPVNGTVHTIAQDFVNPNLLFAGTEFGIFFSYNGGTNWIQLKSGIPTIAVRDIAIHQRENDLVLATFGRGFYILDNYAPLREINENINNADVILFPVKDALSYIQTGKTYGQGSTFYLAPNREYGAIFTYFMKEVPKSTKSKRQEKEKELFKEGKPIPQLTFEQKNQESNEEPSYLIFTITDESGNVVRKITSSPSKGINRVSWDLRYAGINILRGTVEKFDPLKKGSSGIMAEPGNYFVSMAISEKGAIKELAKPQKFAVKALNNTSLPAPNRKELADFQKMLAEKIKAAQAAVSYTRELKANVLTAKQTIVDLPTANPELMKTIQQLESEINNILYAFEGPEADASFEEIPPHELAVLPRMSYLMRAHSNSTSAIMQTERDQLAIIEEIVPVLINKINKLAQEDYTKVIKQLESSKAPWTPGRLPQWK